MIFALPLSAILAGLIAFGTFAVIEGEKGPSFTILREYLNNKMPLYKEPKKNYQLSDK